MLPFFYELLYISYKAPIERTTIIKTYKEIVIIVNTPINL